MGDFIEDLSQDPSVAQLPFITLVHTSVEQRL